MHYNLIDYKLLLIHLKFDTIIFSLVSWFIWKIHVLPTAGAFQQICKDLYKIFVSGKTLCSDKSKCERASHFWQ